MNFSKPELWQRFQKYYTHYPSIGLSLDISRMNFGDDFLASMKTPIQKAFIAMAELEKGGIANPDEKRMVGHYWLRNPSLAPTQTIAKEITDTIAAIKAFAAGVHSGAISGTNGPFEHLLVIGIGGSALGPEFVANALSQPGADKLKVHFFDNTDPDGMDKVLAQIGNHLGQTLTVVISKSGGTKETRNGMIEAQAAYERAGLKFNAHAVAVTGALSDLDKFATQNGWLKRFPMWDWVGGRTSELSAVGLLPAALQGFDIDSLLAGAKACDDITRQPGVKINPAAQLALMWYYIGNGKGSKNMVILPYKDRLELFSKYCQQLVMESLGKEKDLDGKVVNQGIAVFGNKGSTDQHSYVQQLREGILNFFVIFIQVLHDRKGKSIMVEPEVTSGDYLQGFLLGTRQALHENGRESITITIQEVSAFSVGVLIALFERTVGLYASLININAYHQPGVEAGKKAAATVIDLQRKVLNYLDEKRGHSLTSSQIASGIGAHDDYETVFKLCEHLAANPDHGVNKTPGKTPFEASYQRN
ncbi:MAG TPA: glucose-6-phosphate isomerase [Verrucomicrobiae bacterium]|nr:glucose-6-phosphate isomerase [Verrucomicrobiae bacterium]